MKKIAIFTEGQSELIFVRELTYKLIDASKLKLECIELIGGNSRNMRNEYSAPNPEIYFLIVNVNNDEGLITSIKNREIDIFENKGYNNILGLRDLYCQRYDDLSAGNINKDISKIIIENCESMIEMLKYKDKVKVFFAIMEIEAWFLGMYNLLVKIDSGLTLAFIKQKMKIDLQVIDPQKQFYKPSNVLDKIMATRGKRYKKKKNEIEALTRKIETVDIENCQENGRCERFSAFYSEIIKISKGYTYV